MLPASSLSSAAYGLRALFLEHIADLDDVDQIRIGHPADTIKDLENDNDNSLNLFFYDVRYDGYPADGSSDNPFYIRLHCLITAIGHKTREPETPGNGNRRDVSKGENELRMIGEVMRILHQFPLLSIGDADGAEIAQLQVVPEPMNLDNLNHIWSTQSETSYRLSVAYEMALAPVPYALPVEASPLVGDPEYLAWGAMQREPGSEKAGLISARRQVGRIEIDLGRDDWAPHVAFVETVDSTTRQLHYVFPVAGNPDTPLDILVAADNESRVRFYWNVWRRQTDNSIVAWREDIPDTEAPEEKEIRNPPGDTSPFFPGIIDPDDIDTRRVFQARLPAEVRDLGNRNWQAVLYAVREWQREAPLGSGQLVTTPIKSNLLLFYGGAA